LSAVVRQRKGKEAEERRSKLTSELQRVGDRELSPHSDENLLVGVFLGDFSSLRDRESGGDRGEEREADEGGGGGEDHFGEE